MDPPLQNLDHSLNYNLSTTPDDVQNVYRSQRYVPTMPVMPPLGAGLTHPSTSIFRPQVGLGSPSPPLTEHHDPSQVPTPASTNSPSDGSETSLYDTVTSSYGSTSPTPHPPQEYNLRHSLHQYGHPSPPSPTLGTQNNPSSNYLHTSAHSQSWPQQPFMSTPPAAQGGRGGSVDAGPSTGYSVSSASRDHVLELAPPSAKRRSSGVDCLAAQVGFLNQHALENQPTPDTYTSYSWSSSSPAVPTAQYRAAVPANMVPGPPFLHRGSVVSLQSEESFQLSSSSSLQDDLDGGAILSPGHTLVGVLSHSADHILPQQDSSSAAPEAPRKRRRDVQRKQAEDPKYPEATDRLRKQRKKDDQLLDLLFRRYVPSSVAQGRVAKKDRLPLIAQYALGPMLDGAVSQVTTIDDGLDHRPPESSTSQG